EANGVAGDDNACTSALMPVPSPYPVARSGMLALYPVLPRPVLGNNGELMADAIPCVVAPLALRLACRVPCSGVLGGRKPEPRVYLYALDRLGWSAADTPFVDDLFGNVRGARCAGLQADTVRDPRTLTLGRVLKRCRLA